jgi:branched-chain amino acid transport system ATP-binding protein
MEIGMHILDVEDLYIAFRGLVALNGIGFSVERGEIFGLIGTNGSGKSTFFNCVNRLYKPQKGRIIYEGKVDLLRQPSHRIAGLGIARTFQNLELFYYTKVLDNIMVGLHPRLKFRRLLKNLSLGSFLLQWDWDKNEAFKILDFLGITRFHGRLVSGLPYGLQKLIELGRALASKPRLLLLDEPSAGMNEQETREMARLITSIREDLGTTVLLVEHDMNLVQSICDTLCVLDSGNIIRIGKPDEVTRDPEVLKIFLGEENHAEA